MNQEPQFFIMSYGLSDSDPWAASIWASNSAIVSVCPVCGTETREPTGPAVAGHVSGDERADIIGAGGGNVRFMISDRVVVDLQEAGLIKHGIGHTTVQEVTGDDLRQRPLRYCYLSLSGGMDIDLPASGLGTTNRCRVCWRTSDFREPVRLVPIKSSWNGTAIFRLRNYPIATAFCTRAVVEVGRRKRWTNFVFKTIDVLRKYETGWSGIDYLGEKWPPEKWYPDPPGTGKTLDDLLTDMQGTDIDDRYEARLTLISKGNIAIPRLTLLLSHHEPHVAREAALILYGISRTFPLSESLRSQIRPLLDEHLRTVLG
jgi:hypothetical protein